MKRFLAWVLGVVFGVGLFLGAVMGYSWVSTGTHKLPDDTGVAFGGVPLTQNGYLWQVPLMGAVADRVFSASPNLTVQKLGTITDARPELTMPDWASPVQTSLEIENTDTDTVVFSGTMEAYAGFHFASNGNYEAVVKMYRLPGGMAESKLAHPTDLVVKSPDLEHPARPAGWYSYRFGFVLAASPEVHLSAETMRQGDAVAVIVTGMLGENPPVVQSDLGTVQFESKGNYWIGYLPAAYNAEARRHKITVQMDGLTAEAGIRVAERSFGRADAVPEAAAAPGAGEEFRNAIWGLYEAKSGPRQWSGKWLAPTGYEQILISYGQEKLVDGVAAGRSNSTVFTTTPGIGVFSPTAGTVVYAGKLKLTGNTVVIDHGCGVRSYLYGLDSIAVQKGQTVTGQDKVGTTAAQLTFDVKIGSKSIDPWELFNGRGGLFVCE